MSWRAWGAMNLPSCWSIVRKKLANSGVALVTLRGLGYLLKVES